MGTGRRLAWSLLSAAVVSAAFVLTPALGGAAETAPCEPDAARDAAGPASTEAPSSDASDGPGRIAGERTAGNVVTVQVPEGRLYLDPDRLIVPVRPGKPAELPPTLIADLREHRPGWSVSVTLVDLLVDGEPVDGTVTITPRPLTPAVGELHGINRHRASTISKGACAALLSADAGAGWGSYRERPILEATLAEHTPVDRIDVVLQLHIR